MAYKIAGTTGNWSTAGTWYSVPNTPTLHASTNITVSTSNLFTATFTAPNTTDAVTGCLIYIPAIGSSGTVTVTLQDNTVDTTATASIATTSLIPGSWNWFSFGTPYTFASTAAGRYRFKIVNAGAAGTTTAAADSGGANIAYLCATNATGVPASTDYVFIAAGIVTLDGTQSIGNGADTAAPSSTFARSIGHAIQVLTGAILKWDTAASATLTSLGNVVVASGGELQMGTVASPYPSSFVATLTFNENGTSANYGLTCLDGGKLTQQGTAKSSTTLWKTTYSSGVGTAADPLIVADSVDWSVGDEIIIGAASSNATNYQETESRFIKTKNSATSYVLSTTAGGAEAALTYTHTTSARILNVQRNVLINTTNTAQSCYIAILSLTAANVQVKWVRYETLGSSASISKNGFVFFTGNTVGNVDYTVFYRALYRGFFINGSKATQTHTGLIAYGQNAAAAVGAFDLQNSVANKTFVDCFSLGNNRAGFHIVSSNCTFTRCIGISNDTVGSGAIGGMVLGGAYNNTFNDCEMHCNRIQALYMASNVGNTFNNFLCGTKGTNAIDITIITDSFNDNIWNNSTFSSATFISGYLNMLPGSKLRFQKLSGTANNHATYYNTGILRSTGSGLVDTTVRTTGSLAVRLAPEDATNGLTWEFQIPANAGSYVSFTGFFQKNAAFGTDVCRVDLYLPGSTTADATQTLSNTTGSWQAVAIGANYTGTEDLLATVKITAISATSAAYIFVDDMYNAGNGSSTTTNKIAGMDVWDKGLPVTFIVPTTFNAASVWSELTAGMTTSGTIGNFVLKLLTVAKFLGLK